MGGGVGGGGSGLTLHYSGVALHYRSAALLILQPTDILRTTFLLCGSALSSLFHFFSWHISVLILIQSLTAHDL